MIRSATFSCLPPCSLRNALASAAVSTVLLLVGCGDTCVSGFFNPGGQITVTSGASACTLPRTNGAVSTAIIKSGSCQICTPSARVEHVYLTLRGVQLHPSAIAERNSPDWVEIAPQLADEPRQMDLIGKTVPEILAQSAMIPAGSYRQVRLEFLPDPPARGGHSLGVGECGAARQNCIVMGDGGVDPVHWPGGVPELLITGQSMEGGALLVLPDTTAELRISLEPQQAFYSYTGERWEAKVALVGRVTDVRLSKIQSPD